MHINDLLKEALTKGASDIHVKVGRPPILRVDGQLHLLDSFNPVSQEEVKKMVSSILSNSQKRRSQNDLDIDMSYSVSGLGRFRVNVFQQRGSPGLAIRVIPFEIPTTQQLELPSVIDRISDNKRGLVLCTGSSGSGKSTTLAAMANHINSNRSEHIMTIENPIEFLHRDKQSVVNQREVESDTKTFAGALRSALRQDPDVIVLGEMRDYETIATAMMAAETGHLVLSTLHTSDAAETINRICSYFPAQQHEHIRAQLAAVLRATISLRLLPRLDGNGRVPAVEIMITTPFISSCIIDPDKTSLIPEAIAAGGSQYDMQTFDQSIANLYQNNLISHQDALKYSSNREDLELMIQGVQSAAVEHVQGNRHISKSLAVGDSRDTTN